MSLKKKITFLVFNVFLQLCLLKLMRQLLSVEVIKVIVISDHQCCDSHQEALESNGMFWVVTETLN